MILVRLILLVQDSKGCSQFAVSLQFHQFSCLILVIRLFDRPKGLCVVSSGANLMLLLF